ncbi:MAG: hypothetical protein ABI442_12855 [Gemmatimonadaceae bacterium]
MKVSSWTLWLSAFGGGVAWAAALLIVPTLGSVNCMQPLSHTARYGTTWWTLAALTGAALVACCVALGVTVNVLRRPASEPHSERVRFMAFGGLLLNVVFILSLAFFSAGLFLAPVCQ